MNLQILYLHYRNVQWRFRMAGRNAYFDCAKTVGVTHASAAKCQSTDDIRDVRYSALYFPPLPLQPLGRDLD